MLPYHLRRQEKALTTREALLEIIHSQRYLTLALCKEGQPYLVTVNYGFDPATECFYFHCAGEGKKMDYLRANPRVWGQILADDDYLPGECDHAFRSVHFEGRAALLTDREAKRQALRLMIDQLEPDRSRSRRASPQRIAVLTA